MSRTTAVASGHRSADAEPGSDRRADVLTARPGRGRESGARSVVLPRSRPLLVGEVVLVAFLLFGYDRIASVANAQQTAAMRHGWAPWRLEHIAHIAVELPLNGVVAAHRVLDQVPGQVLALYYDFAHGIVTLGVLASLYVLHAELYRGRPATP